MQQPLGVSLQDVLMECFAINQLRNLTNYCFAELKNLGITTHSLFVLIDSWLNVEHMVQYFKTFILKVNNVGILVHAKNFWLVGVGQFVDVVFQFVHVLVLGTIVCITFAELVILLCHNIIILEDLQNVHQQQSVKIIGNSTTIIDLSSHELHCVPRYIFILDQEVFDHCN